MDSSILVRLFGWKASLFHGDPLVLDRWRWIKKRLRKTHHDERLLDIGCGTGAFTIGSAKRGYRSLGLSWNERNQTVAQTRARITGAKLASFEICDVRDLDQRQDLTNSFDVILCCENIEHIIDDFKLMDAMARCLKPGGRLLLTSPYERRIPWSSMDYGPFPDFEDGRHVRRGYNRVMLSEMCASAGLVVEEYSFVSGPISQFLAFLQVTLCKIHPAIGWLAILPFRPLPPLFDWIVSRITGVPYFCIGIDAMKPRRLAANAIPAPSRVF